MPAPISKLQSPISAQSLEIDTETTTGENINQLILAGENEVQLSAALGVEEERPSEIEDGEIPSFPGEEAATGGVWSKVTSTGGRHLNAGTGNALVLEDACIASPTRFEILKNNEEEDVLSFPLLKTEPATTFGTTQSTTLGKDVTLRTPLPRNSKNTHKFLSDSSQHAKATAPSNISKKKSRNRF